MTNFNMDLKVPMMIRYPDQKNRGVKTTAITELIDMFPSLCELADIPVPDDMQGTSFVPLLDNPSLEWKQAAFSQFHRRPKVSADGKRYMGYSINTHDHHYIEWYGWDHKKGERKDYISAELYDSNKDSYETVNLANDDSYGEIVNALSQQLKAGWEAAIPY